MSAMSSPRASAVGRGWSIARDPATVSLLDLHEALGEPTIFAMGNAAENPACLTEQAVTGAMNGAFRDAQALLIARFRGTTLADLADSERRFSALDTQAKEHVDVA